MLAVVGGAQVTDDDAAAGAGVDELAVLQIDAYVGGVAFLLAVVEEYEVAFAQIAFPFLSTIKCALLFGRAVKRTIVHLAVDLRGEA